jgi:iron complex outermembrane recepter protein
MRKIFLLISFLFSTYLLMAQQTYTVTVTDAKTGNAVTNASVIVRATKKGATANADGVFTIQASINDVLEITGIGYQLKWVKINSITNINVSLQASAIELGDVVVVGSRGGARVKTETAVPVDVIKINQVGLPTAKMDLTSILNMAAPSFNYNKQSGADGADHLDLGTLRGLGPDQTLILINGKRRHQTAFVALFGTRGRGASGTDLNAFPQSAVDRIEILRDGASAQYGSDAMAGVMNIRLKKDINHWTINTGWGGYYDTRFNSLKSVDPTQYYTGSKIDGGTYNFSVNNGFKVGKSGGFVNISFDYLNQGKTFRQVPDTNAATNSKALPYYNGGRRAFGDGSVKTAGAMYNMELPIQSSNTIFYSFGGYNQKKSDAFAYTRNLSAKPERFPVDAAGNSIIVPSIMRTSSDGGTYYNPHIGTTIKDLSLALGIKGITNNLWNWDLSFTGGNNNFQYFGTETFNSSLIGNITKTSFDDGGFKFSQATVNADMSKSFKNEGINFAYGVEYRREVYSIYAGEEASYKNYTPTPTRYRILDGTGDSLRVPAAGAQGFPGFSPADVVNASRNVFGAYADAEFNFTTAWLADAAVRFENYSDFGSVATFKLATRYKVSDKFNLRGSASTGFRAPSLQQINFSNTLTSFSAGQLVQSRIANNNDPITKLAGIPKLTQEKSTSLSLGFSSKPAKGLTFTIDGYVTKIKDRVVLSGLFSADDATLPVALTNALKAINVSTAQFFSNAISTTNYGVDVVLDYSTKIGKGNFKGLLAGNIQNISIDAIKVPAALNTNTLNRKTFFSDREEAFVKASAPKSKFAISLEYAVNKVGFGTHFTYFGKVQLKGFGDATPDNPNYAGINPMVPSDANGTYVPENFNYNGKLVTDIFVRYKLCKAVALFIGSDNIFNIHPNLGVVPAARGWAGDNESGGPWDSVQMGFNGRKLFAKLAFNF